MKILFSPAETKRSGGTQEQLNRESFLFPELFEQRIEVIKKYQHCIDTASEEQLSKLFGIKDPLKFEQYRADIFTKPLMKGIRRYDGVAFDYLDYASLDPSAQAYIDQNVMLFSNLFGPILAGDFGLPDYKLKQGEKIDGFAPEIFYKKAFSANIDAFLGAEPYLDLRAGFYNKFYKPSTPYVTLKFLKEGKVVSHWAKAYRGLVLRAVAVHQVKTIDDFYAMPIEGLTVKEILKKGIHTEIVFDLI